MIFIYAKLATFYKKSNLLLKFDKVLGIIPSVSVGLFLVSVLMLLILTLPVKAWLREPIQESWWSNNVVSRSLGLVPAIEKALNEDTDLLFIDRYDKDVIYQVRPISLQ